jgi:SAM-dependent methyltransferase
LATWRADGGRAGRLCADRTGRPKQLPAKLFAQLGAGLNEGGQHGFHYTETVQKDPLIRSVDPASARLQLFRRSPHAIAQHPLWQEAQARLKDRLTYIRCPSGPVVEHGIAQFGVSLNQPPGSVAMVWSVGLLAYLSNARATLAFWSQMLAPGGLLMFACLGPDSFRPLALALDDPGHERHVAGYPDMHDLGDALVGLGMGNPVMDVERVFLTYSSPELALTDLRILAGNPLIGRPKGLMGRAWRAKILGALESLRQGSTINLPVEMVFGHAWAKSTETAKSQPSEQQAAGSQVQEIYWVSKKPKNSPSGI